MSKTLSTVLILVASLTLAADQSVDRWAAALGGRDKIAALKAVYREASVQVGSYQGTIKVWHTADGKYRKDEKVAAFSNTETFDGTKGMIQQGLMPARAMTEAELEVTRSKRFSNWNAIFFVLFSDRHHGSVVAQNANTLSFKPDGGIEWQVELDSKTSLPKSMTHNEGGQTITVTFESYETVDGLQFEKEIHRSGGGMNRVIRFTKTVINPEIESSLFSIQ
jgi:hypothetical protein